MGLRWTNNILCELVNNFGSRLPDVVRNHLRTATRAIAAAQIMAGRPGQEGEPPKRLYVGISRSTGECFDMVEIDIQSLHNEMLSELPNISRYKVVFAMEAADNMIRKQVLEALKRWQQ